MDSDDYLADGALQMMRQRAINDRSDIVIAPIKKVGKRNQSFLPTWRTSNLDPVKDRLFYRSAPLGLFPTELMQQSGMHFDKDAATGEDLRVTAQAWTSGARISYYWDDPAYVVSQDASSRATGEGRPLRDTGAVWPTLWDEEFVSSWSSQVRSSFATKMARVHFADVLAMHSPGQFNEQDFVWFSRVLQRYRSEVSNYDAAMPPEQRVRLRAIEHGIDIEGRPGTTVSRSLPESLASLRHRDSDARWKINNYIREKVTALRNRASAG